MPEIVLATLNAKYIHASLGLRSLLANLGELRARAALAEFTIQERPLDVAERLLALEPRIVALGVYVWNVAPTTELVALLKRVRPDLVVVLGGPEVSHEPEAQEIVRLADCTIRGEGERALPEVCRAVLTGGAVPAEIVAAAPPDLATLALPYDEYTDEDIAHRLVYVEASRGCPFSCEFCLSSLDEQVRPFPLEAFLAAMDRLLARGVRHFKFVDRTFNLHLPTSRRILEFFLARLMPGLFLHFEMVPDRLPTELRELLARFPAGSLQLEIGIQSYDPAVTAAISRRQDLAKLEDNFRYLRAHTHAHLHADLIIGLPGETAVGFGAGFDRLAALAPHEIQVGLLKRLRGAPIARHDAAETMIYSPVPPYEILRNRVIDFATMQRLRRFARYWDLVGNSGNFVETLPLFWSGAASCGAAVVATALGCACCEGEAASPFAEFLWFSDWFFAREGRHHALALSRTMERVFEFLVHERGLAPEVVAAALLRDCGRIGYLELPAAVRPFASREGLAELAARRGSPAQNTKRQARHRAT
ncbi:MAG TPA: DUF4080 domain-containing protein [Opitutaceae bacterium]|nr:DUF4080 domain-containing protein [Opitutaceae bacterium]